MKQNKREMGCGTGTYVKPAAFHAKVMVIGVLLDVLLFGCLEVVVAFDVSLSLKRPSLSDGDASRDAQPALQHKKKKKHQIWA